MKTVFSRSHRLTPATGILSRWQIVCARRYLHCGCRLYKWQNNKQRVSGVTVTMASTARARADGDRVQEIKPSFCSSDMMWRTLTVTGCVQCVWLCLWFKSWCDCLSVLWVDKLNTRDASQRSLRLFHHYCFPTIQMNGNTIDNW